MQKHRDGLRVGEVAGLCGLGFRRQKDACLYSPLGTVVITDSQGLKPWAESSSPTGPTLITYKGLVLE